MGQECIEEAERLWGGGGEQARSPPGKSLSGPPVSDGA